eukprot:TRINITY_DN5789_c0_g1_i1.p1 TRINITY_DN5789_c0_g1~~TRINITY_DN5789_c0_g1_i1.p1  ORF type:complete len:513 (-),score=93.46 TRINITY_DN5789_c0_g1_i1:784-2322(-)
MLTQTCRRATRKFPQVVNILERSLHTTAPALSSGHAPAVSSSPSAWSYVADVFGISKPVQLPPLYEPLPGVRIPPPPADVQVLETNTTVLPNGLTIASEHTPGATANVSLHIDSGSIYETPLNSGASHLLERMAFKSTIHRTHFGMIRELEAIGCHVTAGASREAMGYTADGIKTYLPEMLELLADAVRNQAFYDWEVKEQAEKVSQDVFHAGNNPQSLILEAIHAVGYAGALANPLLANPAGLGRLNGQALFDFVEANYTAPRMVLSASGVDHHELCALADPLFSDMPFKEPPPVPESIYTGGDWRAPADSPETHLVLGFELAGGWRNEPDAVVCVVLQALMGGGLSFSPGGPGKGMHSRLYKNVLNEHDKVASTTFFSNLCNDSGIVGIYATAESSFAGDLVDIVSKELIKVATPGGVSHVELERAKNATIAGVYMNLESRGVIAEDIGRQVLTYGHRKPASDFVHQVRAVSAGAIQQLAQKFLGTPLVMASYGNVGAIPKLDSVAARFR